MADVNRLETLSNVIERVRKINVEYNVEYFAKKEIDGFVNVQRGVVILTGPFKIANVHYHHAQLTKTHELDKQYLFVNLMLTAYNLTVYLEQWVP